MCNLKLRIRKENTMKKVLIVITTSFVSCGGLTSVMMNYYRSMNKNGLKIDFASTNDDVQDELLHELEKNGSSYYCLGNRKKNLLNYINNLNELLKKKKYDVIHVNGNSATMLFELYIAKKNKIKVRIAHGHTTRSDYMLLHNILKPFFRRQYTLAISTSEDAGKWLYKDKYLILNNAIDTSHYEYNLQARNRIRQKLNLENNFVLGNVGKLNNSKNHVFLLEIMKCIINIDKNAKLILVGGGTLENKLKQKAQELEISQSVIFLGMRDDTSDFLQAMDVFVFPSKFEGLGMAVIEAQASGLVCFASNTIPKETKVSDNILYVDLNKSAYEWAQQIIKNRNYNRESFSKNAKESITKCGYEISTEAIKLEKIYKQ